MSENLKNIVLVGFMGCGKSTLGKKIANKLGFEFIDMDAEIEKQHNLSISEIFKQKGEEYFRLKEHEYLKSLTAQTNLVISTGGGTPCFYNNMEIINRIGKSVYIELPAEALALRLQNEKNKRPLIANLNKQELLSFINSKLKERTPFYSKSKITFKPLKTSDAELIKSLA
jgi:shikimate kinase